MSRRHNDTSLILNFFLGTGFVIAEVAAVASALIIWFFAGLSFFGEPVVRGQYFYMATGFALAGTLLVLGLVAMQRFEPAVGVTVLGVVLAVACGVGALVSLLEASRAPRGDAGEVWWWPFEFFFWLPTTWPMLVVIAAATLRELWSREPRLQPAQQAAPGRRPSR